MSACAAAMATLRNVRYAKFSGALLRAACPRTLGVEILAPGAPRPPISARDHHSLVPRTLEQPLTWLYTCQLRWKSKKSKAKARQEADESDDDEDEEDDEEVDEDTAFGDNVRTAFVSSLRVDSIMKAGIGMSKAKVVEAFYSSLIRLNGNRISKKSTQLEKGDELDFIVGLKADNPNLMEVHRVTLLQVHSDQLTDKGRFKVKLRRQKNLTIEKYVDYE
uniref:Mitochondrial transcription rescue factor 1 C-terminal domain-containing protein n=1 Tax=Ixodes ricinus TaxID=34613 RepID=A0A0K8RG33_IXORI